MEVRVAVLADGANVAAGEKLNIFGIFDTIFAPQFPVVMPSMVLAIRFRLDHEDANRSHVLEVQIRNDAGDVVGKAEVHMDVGAIPDGFSHVNQVLAFAGAVFESPGRYEFRVVWDGREKSNADLRVRERVPPQ